jgi:predicted dehydrogenase
MSLRTAVIGVGSLGRQHARIHGALAAEGRSQFVAVCDLNEETARSVSEERTTEWVTDWRELIGRVDAVSLAVPTEAHCEIACGLLENGIHVLVEKPISRTLEEADRMIRAAEKGNAMLQVGHLERFNPAMVALKPYVKKPVYFEIHRVGQFTARSLDIDVVLDLMIHDLDIVQWLVGEEVEVTNIHAVGIAILTNRVDAANARLEFSSGAVANITASRVGTEKIRKMRFFQPHDYVAIDYTTKRASVSSLEPPSASGSWPGVHIKHLYVVVVEPLRAVIVSFVDSAENGLAPAVSGSE